jgi:hypothetical protein
MRHGPLTTDQAIDILIQDDCVIYWNEEGYEDVSAADWMMIAIFFNTDEIHTYCHGMKTVVYL